MPLTRETVTAASRIMLPTYVALMTVLGLVYTFDPFGRLAGVHALAAPRYVMGGSMRPWGVIFLALAAVMCLAFTRRDRPLFAFGLSCCATTMLIWAGMYTASIFIDPETSLLAPVWPLFVVAACVASTASLLSREV